MVSDALVIIEVGWVVDVAEMVGDSGSVEVMVGINDEVVVTVVFKRLPGIYIVFTLSAGLSHVAA